MKESDSTNAVPVAGRTWRLRRWPNDDKVAHLVFTDHLDVPSPSDLARALASARESGAQAVRTSALFPRAARAAAIAGFEPLSMLALMRLDLEQPPSEQVEAKWHARPIRIRHRQIAASVDLEAFGPSWGNDLAGLTDIMRATPKVRSRWVRASGEFAGFAISGAAGDTGYIQRVAVASAYRRLGIADYLVRDAITWMRKNKLAGALVNAEVTNAAALALYASLGFLPMPEQLTIAQHTFVESRDEF